MALYCALVTVLLFAPQQDFVAEGLKALDAQQPAAAETLLRQAVEANGNDVPAHFNLALALSLEQKDAEAIQELRKTLELQPGLYQAYTNLGTLLLRNKRPVDAVPVLKEAVRLKPDGARATQLYARALLETGDLAEAEKYYRAAAELDPQYKDGLLELAAEKERLRLLQTQQAVDSGNFAAAIPGLEAAVKAMPSVANRLSLADAYKQNKQIDKAIEQLQLAAATEPANYDVRMDLGRELRDQRKFMPAAQQFAAAAKIRPDSVKAWNELGAVLVVNEDYAGALAALDRVRALGKEVPGDFYYRAISLEKLRQPKPAMEAYRQFLAADGGKLPDQEFLARQRIRIIENELNRR